MTTLSPLNGVQGIASQPQSAPRDNLGQADFLTLMITQFKNQDPFEPMDNGQFLGQLAQFSTVNGIDSLISSFSGLAGSVQDNQALQAASLVGHSVLAITDIGYLGDAGEVRGAIELESSASNVQIDVIDSSGALVQRLDLGQQPTGIANFSWDGITADGTRAPNDQYQFTARVIRGTNTESAATVIESRIESVTLGQFGGGMSLNFDGGQSMPLSRVFQIIG